MLNQITSWKFARGDAEVMKPWCGLLSNNSFLKMLTMTLRCWTHRLVSSNMHLTLITLRDFMFRLYVILVNLLISASCG